MRSDFIIPYVTGFFLFVTSMETCTVSNVRTMVVIVVLVLSALGLWTFHDRVTCRGKMYRRACVQKAFVLSLVIMGLLFAVSTLVLMNSERQDLDRLISE